MNTLKGTIELYHTTGGRAMPEDAKDRLCGRLHRVLHLDPRWIKRPGGESPDSD